jgi:hypothetical protein
MRPDAALNDVAAEFDQLRTKLLRAARSMVLTEDRRAAMLDRLAARAHPAAARDLRADAHQARANADTATAIVVQMERMRLEAVSSTGQPRTAPTAASSSGTGWHLRHPAPVTIAGR